MHLSRTRLRRALRKATARTREESGIAVVVAIGMLSAALVLSMAAAAAVGGDIPLVKGDQDRKQAYAAAEAGMSFYQYHLDQDTSYWSKCTNVPPPSSSEPSPVNQAWSGSGVDPRNWRTIPGSSAAYTIELLPAAGYSQCIQGSDGSMLDPDNGTFRIRATGRAGSAKRSIVATFKRKGFLDFLYFTDYETLDPGAYSDATSQAWASANCVKYHPRPAGCTDIQFVSVDTVAGPFHTNDSFLVCGTPTFGRNAADRIEASGSWWNTGSCTGNPNFLGTYKPGAQPLPLPVTNRSLLTIAAPAYVFTGTTTIRLAGTSMTVTNANLSPTTQTMAFPANGVVYVRNGSCGTTYKRKQTYSDPTGCANLYVSGTFSQDLTLASENDIIVRPPTGSSTGDIIGTNGAVLGLIPNNFARIYHPVTSWRNGDADCDNDTGTMTNVEIDAAVLALNHSFIVDNYYCGARLGTLTVKGAIAQKFRGPVGTGGGSGGTGYSKSYRYEDSFEFRDPPAFLNPVQSTWTIRRYTEQSPAR
jgi:predicted lipoprotein with Yx(FWY)xxD motif